MRIRYTLYFVGISVFFIFIILGQVLWLFDPVRIGQSTYWIEILDFLVYLGMITPLLWSISAVWGIRSIWNPLKRYRIFLRLAIFICSASEMYIIITNLNQLLWLGIFLAAAWILIVLDIFIEEGLVNQMIPKRGYFTLIYSAVLLALLLWPTSYMVTYPGLTVNMNQYVSVEEGKPKGEIMGVLVFERPAVPIDWLYAGWFAHYEFEKRPEIEPPLDEQLYAVREMKLYANRIATAAALEKAGVGSGVIFQGARVVGLLENAPAADVLHIGDVIIEINDLTVASKKELIDYLKGTVPGERLMVTVLRDNERIKLNLKTLSSAGSPNQAVIGIQVIDEVRLDLPLKVTFQPYLAHQGGPSHGAMMALALIDQLLPEGVTNGKIVAGTGTINLDGTIGRIGGIKQKAYTVERAGADVFFVPASQLEEARRGSKSLNIVPVRTLDDILNWLMQHPAT
jgi:PDZ domain-containing protein